MEAKTVELRHIKQMFGKAKLLHVMMLQTDTLILYLLISYAGS